MSEEFKFDVSQDVQVQPEPCEPAKTYRAPDSYTTAELAGMPANDRDCIRARQAVQGFHRWLDAFENSWGFAWRCDCDAYMVQKLPHEDLTLSDLQSLSRGSGKPVSELQTIVAKAKSVRAGKESNNGKP